MLSMADEGFLGWDDEIEKDGAEFVVLPEGDYDFQVTKLERTTSNTSGAPMAVLELKLDKATITDRLVLMRSAEWKLTSFFVCIGLRKHGERYKPEWNKVVGARGTCRVAVEDWKDKNGNMRKQNKIKSYLEPTDVVPFDVPSVEEDALL